jgi:hypothetical protein
MDSISQGVLPEINGNQIYDGCHIENRSAENRKEPYPAHPQHAQSKWIRSAKAFSPKLTETNYWTDIARDDNTPHANLAEG